MPHISVLESGATLAIMTVENKYYCPLCVTAGAPREFRRKAQANKHYQTIHLTHSIKYEGYLLLICRLGCFKRSHYHCPFCDRLNQAKTRAIKHNNACRLNPFSKPKRNYSVHFDEREAGQPGTTLAPSQCLYCGEKVTTARLAQHMMQRHRAEAEAEKQGSQLLDAADSNMNDGNSPTKGFRDFKTLEKCGVCEQVIISSMKEQHMKEAHAPPEAQDDDDAEAEVDNESLDANVQYSSSGSQSQQTVQKQNESSTYSLMEEEDEEELENVRYIKQELDCSDLDVLDRELLLSTVPSSSDPAHYDSPSPSSRYASPTKSLSYTHRRYSVERPEVSGSFSTERIPISSSRSFGSEKRQVGVSGGFVNKLKRSGDAGTSALELRECMSWSESVGLRMSRLPLYLRAKLRYDVETKLLEFEFGGDLSDASVQTNISGPRVCNCTTTKPSRGDASNQSPEVITCHSAATSIEIVGGEAESAHTQVKSKRRVVVSEKPAGAPAEKRRHVDNKRWGEGRAETIVLTSSRDLQSGGTVGGTNIQTSVSKPQVPGGKIIVSVLKSKKKAIPLRKDASNEVSTSTLSANVATERDHGKSITKSVFPSRIEAPSDTFKSVKGTSAVAMKNRDVGTPRKVEIVSSQKGESPESPESVELIGDFVSSEMKQSEPESTPAKPARSNIRFIPMKTRVAKKNVESERAAGSGEGDRQESPKGKEDEEGVETGVVLRTAEET